MKEFLELSIGSITVGNILLALVLLIICIIAIKLINRVVAKTLEKTKIERTMHEFIRSMIKIVLYFVAILIITDSLGIPVSSLLAVLSIAGLAASLAMQDALSNLASGVMLLVTHPFKVGDQIETNGEIGKVKSISLVYTELYTADNKTIFIPNKLVVDSKSVNYSGEKKRRVDINISASYDADIQTVKRALLETVQSIPQVDFETEPLIRVSAYESSSIQYVIRMWCAKEDYWTVYYDFLERVKGSFDKYGIEMTYDHLNVHIEK